MLSNGARLHRPDVVSVWLIAGLLPLAAWPFGADGAFPLRLVVLGAAIALGFWSRSPMSLDRATFIALGVALVAFAAAGMAGRTPLLSLLGRFQRYEGLPVVIMYAGCLVLGARLLTQPRLRAHFLSGLAVSTLILAIEAVAETLIHPGQRVATLLGNASMVGLWGVIAAVMLGWASISRSSPLWRVGACAGLALVATSASRGALIGLAAGAAGMLMMLVRNRSKAVRWLPVAGVVATTALALALPLARGRILSNSPLAATTVEGRELLWQEAVHLIARHPWLGVGPSRFVDEIPAFHTAAWQRVVGPYAPPDSAHMLLLQIAGATGLVGVLAVTCLLGTLVRAAYRSRSETHDLWRSGAMVLVLSAAVTYSTGFTDPVTTAVVLAVLGGAVGASEPATWMLSKPRVLRPIGGFVLTLGLLLGGSALISESMLTVGLEDATTRNETTTVVAATRVRPWDADLIRRAGYALVHLDDNASTANEGRLLLESACPDLPGSIECVTALADADDLTGDPAESLQVIDRALTIDRFNVDLLLRRGVALAKLDDSSAAEATFRRAAELRPSAPEPWDNLAVLYDGLGREVDARTARLMAARLRAGR